MRILVVGATGRVGGACVKQLLADGAAVRALVRSADKARPLAALGCEAVVGDVFDRAAVARAVDGVDGIAACLAAPRGPRTTAAVYLRTGVEGNRNLIEAAEAAAAPPHFVYISSLNADRARYFADFEAKMQTEARLRASKLPWTILRPSGYLESLLDEFIQKGTVQYAGSLRRPANPVAAEDVGAATARVFSRPELRGETIELYGPERLGFIDAIEKWSRLAGRPLKYRAMPLPAFWVLAQLMAPVAPVMRQIYQLTRALDEHDWSGAPAALEALLGRPPIGVETFAARARVDAAR